MSNKDKKQMLQLVKMSQNYVYIDKDTTDVINENLAYDLDSKSKAKKTKSFA